MKIALNAGHGYNTAGKRCLKSIDPKETREYVLNKRICDKIEIKLSKYNGVEVLRIDDGTELTISQRAQKANKWKADFYLAIHHNAGINGGNGGGISVFRYTYANDAVTKSWQKNLYDAMIATTGLNGNRSNPIQTANLGECRETSMPAVLCECGFMDSKIDTPIILTDTFAEQVANACVKVIVAKSGAKLKEVKTESTTNQVKPTVASSTKYFAKYTGKSTSIVDALKSVGASATFAYRAKIAKANGIKTYLGTAKQNTQMLTMLKNGKLVKP